MSVHLNLEGAWEAEESRTGTGTVKAGGPALPQNPVTAPRPGTMETPAGTKPCQHTGQPCCKHTHTHTFMPYSNNAGHCLLSRQILARSIIHPKSYGPLTHRQEDQLLLCINSWSFPQILMMFTVYCCISTWLTTCFQNKWTESGYLRLRGRDWQGQRHKERNRRWNGFGFRLCFVV